METARPSRTAYGVAVRRAVHQLFDTPPLVLDDPVAVPLLGEAARERIEEAGRERNKPFDLAIRARLVARSRYAEDLLARAVGDGVTQYILLGAGLDTYAFRNPHPRLRVFEIDHPATQQWKRELVGRAGLERPASLTWAPVDFEAPRQAGEDPLAHGLVSAGFDPARPAFFAWLGVVPYLTVPAFRATLEFIAGCAPGSGLVFDYGQPRDVLPPAERAMHAHFADRVARAGEPFRLFMTPAQVAGELGVFFNREDLGAGDLNALYFTNRPDGLRCFGEAGRLVSAWV